MTSYVDFVEISLYPYVYVYGPLIRILKEKLTNIDHI